MCRVSHITIDTYRHKVQLHHTDVHWLPRLLAKDKIHIDVWRANSHSYLSFKPTESRERERERVRERVELRPSIKREPGPDEWTWASEVLRISYSFGSTWWQAIFRTQLQHDFNCNVSEDGKSGFVICFQPFIKSCIWCYLIKSTWVERCVTVLHLNNTERPRHESCAHISELDSSDNYRVGFEI